MSDYTLRATGGQIPAFEVPYFSPGELTSITPDPTASTPFVINRAQPLPLTWESIPDGRPVYLTFTQQDFPEMTPWMWMCKMTDDGAFEVPLAVVQDFGATVEPFPTEEWRDTMDLRRYHYGSFVVPGAVGPMLSAFESGWYADVRFQ
jgi:hypothetical protein